MFQKGLEMFRFPVVKSLLRFPNVKIVAVPATSFANDFGSLRSVESILLWEEGFDATGVLKNNFNINKRVETINTRFKTFSNQVAMETYVR